MDDDYKKDFKGSRYVLLCDRCYRVAPVACIKGELICRGCLTGAESYWFLKESDFQRMVERLHR